MKSNVMKEANYPLRQIEFKQDEDGKGYTVTDGNQKFRVRHPHDIDLRFISDVFRVHPRSVWLAQVKCPDYRPEWTVKDDFFEDDKFIPKLLAEKIMEMETFVTSQQSRETFVWREGHYQPRGDIEVEKHSEHFLQQEFRKNRYGEALEYTKVSTFTEIVEPPLHLINVENGIVNIINGGLEPHNPAYHFFSKIPVEYDPKCKAPLIRKFLRDITGSEEDAEILEEVVGYCLYRGYPIQKALALVGEGENGKSTFLSLVQEFLGRENVSGRSLLDLEMNRFAKASLFGKLANLYADLPDSTLERTGTFKMFTGGDLIEAEKKFKNSFTFVNHAKLIFSCNKLPKVTDDTDAFFRRWIMLVFPNQFNGDDCDPNILEKLTVKEEMSGLLNIAIRGLRSILQNGGFSHSRTTEEIREDYVRKSDPLAAFVLDCLEEDQDSTIVKSELYGLFALYCRENSLAAVNSDTFFKNLPKEVPTVTQVRLRRKDITGRPYAFKGIRLTQIGQKYREGSRGSNGSTLLPILVKEANDGRDIKKSETLDSLDPSDPKQITMTCGPCEFFHTSKCVREKPHLISRTATYAGKCDNYREGIF